MATFRRGVADTDRLDTVPAHRTSTPARRAALLAAVAVLGLLTGCGNDTPHSTPQKLPGTAEPASGDRSSDGGTSATAGPSGSAAPTASATVSGATSGAASASSGTASGSSRCHTSELRASVGANNPGAGQENFPVVLTNSSGRTCTVRGYPGAAFVDASGKQLGPDPRRSSSTPTTVTLAPGHSAWAGLTFSNPEISGARTATPAALLVTPPDEKDSLKVTWTQGKVPVSGNASSVSLTVVQAGTGV
ncbi:DUF4232 domain-containing protein [Streptomyces sp. NPDC048415]|jgi:hypothetical protein|uniref:DUF4232 domain-containing protein n=1 Tax=Streptomyces sp. NPDC048415 TaxID=3154822 RepID=UPI00341D64B4